MRLGTNYDEQCVSQYLLIIGHICFLLLSLHSPLIEGTWQPGLGVYVKFKTATCQKREMQP